MKISLNSAPIFYNFYRILLLVLFINTSLSAQSGIKYNSADAYKGFTLCSANDKNTYLLDNCGKVVNKWTNTRPEHYCRLTNEGNLLYIRSNRIIEKTWNGNTVVSILPNSEDLFLDYEVMKLENGNYLAVARRFISSSDFDDIGWDANITKPGRIDGMVEITPNGNIAWEWNIKDHTIQDRIPSAPNYGNIKDHPELVDVNTISDFDWQDHESFMINGFDYNTELDQIVISVRKMSEIMIIDHSTTTEEAKESTGGRYGKGGDILYRWGNPQNYRQGTELDRMLYFQHNPNWVKFGEHKGKIIMYNNGLTKLVPGFDEFSSVHIIDTPINNDGSYNLTNNQAYQPIEPDVTIDEFTTGHYFYSAYTSGVQVLPNGNIYITVGGPADFIEITPEGTVAWEYALDFTASIFRSEKYAPDFPGFEGRDLTGNGTVENPSSSYACELFTSTQDNELQSSFTIHYDHMNAILTVNNLNLDYNTIIIQNMHGQFIQTVTNVVDNSQFDVSDIPFGMYLITLYNPKSNQKSTRKFVKY